MVRKIPMMLVMKWETPSKKKNYLQYKQICSDILNEDPYIGGLNSSNQHNPTSNHYCDERDDVEDSKDIEDDVALAVRFGKHLHGVDRITRLTLRTVSKILEADARPQDLQFGTYCMMIERRELDWPAVEVDRSRFD